MAIDFLNTRFLFGQNNSSQQFKTFVILLDGTNANPHMLCVYC